MLFVYTYIFLDTKSPISIGLKIFKAYGLKYLIRMLRPSATCRFFLLYSLKHESVIKEKIYDTKKLDFHAEIYSIGL